MTALWVVEPFDVVEHLGACGVLGGVDPPPDPLAFEQTEEALHRGIVMAVATSTHAAHQAVGHQETAPVIAGVDRPLVRMNQATGAGLAPPHRRQQGLHDQLGIGSIAHRPADDLPGKQINHHSQVHPAFMRADKGEVARPGRVRLGHVELPIQQVGCRLARHSAMEARFATIAHLGTQPIGAHQPMHPMATATLAQIAQILGDLAMPIHTAAGQPVVLDQPQQAFVFLGALTVGRLQPRVVSSPVHPQHPAHRAHPEFFAVGLHEDVLCLYPLAKYAAAFFRMSRSSVTRRNSVFSRRTSALWSTSARCTTPGLPNVRSQAYRLCVVTPSRCATSATLKPRSVTYRTASILNSSVYRLLLMDTSESVIFYDLEMSRKHWAYHFCHPA